MLDLEYISQNLKNFKEGVPFHFSIIDNFLPLNLAKQSSAEFLPYESPKWVTYNNAVQIKKATSEWHNFSETIYQILFYLNSPEFVSFLSNTLDIKLYSDPGLHAGGCHIHSSGGILAPHLDYNIHPKLGLKRKLNLLVYLTEEYKTYFGGHLGFYKGVSQPEKLMIEIPTIFNRAVLFDTSQNSWHGLSQDLIMPSGIYRKSLAVYYLTDPGENEKTNKRALFFLGNHTNSKDIPHQLVEPTLPSTDQVSTPS